MADAANTQNSTPAEPDSSNIDRSLEPQAWAVSVVLTESKPGTIHILNSLVRVLAVSREEALGIAIPQALASTPRHQVHCAIAMRV